MESKKNKISKKKESTKPTTKNLDNLKDIEDIENLEDVEEFEKNDEELDDDIDDVNIDADVDIDIDETEDLDNTENKSKKILKSKNKKIDDNDNDDDDEEDEDEDDEDEELDLLDNIYNIKKKIYDRTSIITDEKIILVRPENRITSDFMTDAEYSMVVGERATHISNGSPIFTNYDGLTDSISIAEKEIDEGKCPLSISRKIFNRIEIWEVNELIKPNL
jgi:DNA-directed RNA polymerase subunit K/omega